MAEKLVPDAARWAVDSAAGAGEMLGHALDRAVAAGEQQAHDLVDLLLPACRTRLDRLDPLAQIARDQRMRARDPALHVVHRQQDRVVLGVERHAAAEEVAVALAVVRRRIMQMHLLRPPVMTEQRLDDAVDAAERHVDRLARRARLPSAEMQCDGHGLLVACNVKPHAVMMDMDETRKRLDRFADGRLFAHDQADRAEVGQAAAFGEAQAEIFGAGHLCR
ncbi:hypothetical protein ABIF34_000827 [Bradyrhizobium japonicum]